MYLQHFGLEKNPFSLTPDPRFLFLTSKHREALAGLLFAVSERKGFMVLTGDAGTGKTTLVRKLLLSIPLTCAQFSVIVNPALTRSELLETVLMDFGESDVPASKPLRLALLKRLLLQAQAEGKTSVLVIDEAHLLTGELIDEVRLLSNVETSEQKLLQIILVGQNELDTLLAMESLRQLKQRIAIRVHVEPLAEPEVKRYLQARWNRAGAQQPLPFSDEAVQLVARHSGGIPRVVNAISDAALVNAFGAGVNRIDVPHVHEVLRDLGIAALSLPPPLAQTPVREVPQAQAPITRTGSAQVEEQLITAPMFGTLDRYAPAKRNNPKLLKIANFFGMARTQAE